MLAVTFTVNSADNGASIVTWAAASTVDDQDKFRVALETFYGLFTKLLTAKFAAK